MARVMTAAEKALVEKFLATQTGKKKFKNPWHNNGADGASTVSTFRAIDVPGWEFGRPVRFHRYLRQFVAPKGPSRGFISPYTKSDLGECVCLATNYKTAADECPVCADVAKANEYMYRLAEEGKELKASVIKGSVTQFKAKDWSVWAAITRGGIVGAEKQPDRLEAYRLQTWFYNKSILEFLGEKNKEFSLKKWVEKNIEELKDMNDDERRVHWLMNCGNKHGLLYDLAEGWDMSLTKAGSGVNVTYSAAFEDDSPIVAGNADFVLLAEAKKNKSFPDLFALTKPLSAEELRAKLGPFNGALYGASPVAVEESPESVDEHAPDLESVDLDAVDEAAASADTVLASVETADPDDVPF